MSKAASEIPKINRALAVPDYCFQNCAARPAVTTWGHPWALQRQEPYHVAFPRLFRECGPYPPGPAPKPMHQLALYALSLSNLECFHAMTIHLDQNMCSLSAILKQFFKAFH